MFLIHFKIAWRNLTNNLGYSIINISGLAIGMTVAMLITLWLNDELNYNTNFKNYSQIGQVLQSQGTSGDVFTDPVVPRPLEKVLRTTYNEYFKYLTMSKGINNILKYGDTKIAFDGLAMQSDAPKIFSLNMMAGVQNGLDDINSIMLSKSAAKKLFGTANPIGKSLQFDLENELTVTGVFEDFPFNSEFYDTHFFITWDLLISKEKWIQNSETIWDNNSFQLYFQLADNTSFETVEDAIKWSKKEITKDGIGSNPELHVHPMYKWNLYNNFENRKQVGGDIEYVILVSSIGIIILLLACINFMNLTTARAEKRAKEVGVKKTLGAERKHLIQQFYSESLVMVCISFIIAILLMHVFLNTFNTVANKKIVFPWTDLNFWCVSMMILIITAIFSGSYPALYLSKFKPIQVLKGAFVKSKYSGLPRRILVIFQFILSITLIIMTIVFNQQMEFVKSKSKGYDMNALIELPTNAKPFKGKYKLMRQEFLKTNAIVNMSASSSPVTIVYSNRSFFTWQGKPDGLLEDFVWVDISKDYIETLKLNLTQGALVSTEINEDSASLLYINNTAVKYMGLKNPIGELVRMTHGQKNAPPLKIVGVLNDMVMGDPYRPSKQTFFHVDSENTRCYQMRLNPENSVSENLSLIEEKWTALAPNVPFEYDFVDSNYSKMFAKEEHMTSLISIFTTLAIFISCLGLFGLTSFIAEQRTKEIGIRKSIGASVFQIWSILTIDFMILVIISSLIATPVAYVLSQHWLSNFKIRTPIYVWYFGIGIFLVFVLSIATVSFHAIKAARANPIKSLKTE